LMRYPWPGNVRELRNLIESLLVLEKGKYITPEILEKHLVQRNRYKSLVHDPAKSEKNELQVIYSTLILLRQEVSDIRLLLQHLVQTKPFIPLLLPDASATHPPIAAPLRPAFEENSLPPPTQTLRSLDDIEKKSIADTLETCHGNKRKTAMALGITERTLYRKIKAYDL
ncbi:MAG: helix-turn-helix domain-containing protein, partial [Chlorobiaceae bacterium]